MVDGFASLFPFGPAKAGAQRFALTVV